MTPATPLPTELLLLGWSVVLLIGHIVLQGVTATREQGLTYNAGPRDAAPKPLGTVAARARRTLDNFRETYPAFIALALALAVSGRTGGVGATGAWLWLVARVVYVPLYVLGVPWLRSVVWAIGLIGLVLMVVRLLAG